jgi:hypothetical protein
MGRIRIAISMKALCCRCQICPLGERAGKTYKPRRNECENGAVHALGCWMGIRVEDGIQRHTLKDIEKPRYDRKDGVQSHGSVNQVSESSGCGKAEIEK